jgi:hypothetical protein
MWGVDVNLFQFQGMLTWAVFFLNADKTIYGRYGSRGARTSRKDNDKDVSLQGFKKALEGALELHQAYPGNKAALAGKTGKPRPWKTPEAFPFKPNAAGPAERTQGKGCIHCHDVQDSEFKSVWKAGQPVPDRLLWTYPMPDDLGLVLDANERATVARVVSGSPADKGGFRTGDTILTIEGQPPISVSDVQWVLHNADEPSTLKAQVDRGGKKVDVTLALAAGWRRKTEYTLTQSLGWVTRNVVAGMRMQVLDPAEKSRLGLPASALAIKVVDLAPDFARDRNTSARTAGIQKNDVIVEVDGLRAAMTESEFIAYLIQKKGKGQKVGLSYARGGQVHKVQLDLP